MSGQLQSRLNRLADVGYDLSCPVAMVFAQKGHVDPFQEGQTNMDVSGIGSVSGGSPIRGVTPTATTQPATAPIAVPKDELEISSAGKMLDRLSEAPEVRAERIAQIKEAIENGAYDTDEKLEAALSRMFDSLGIDLDD